MVQCEINTIYRVQGGLASKNVLWSASRQEFPKHVLTFLALMPKAHKIFRCNGCNNKKLYNLSL